MVSRQVEPAGASDNRAKDQGEDRRMNALVWIAIIVVSVIVLVTVLGRELEEFGRRYGGD